MNTCVALNPRLGLELLVVLLSVPPRMMSIPILVVLLPPMLHPGSKQSLPLGFNLAQMRLLLDLGQPPLSSAPPPLLF